MATPSGKRDFKGIVHDQEPDAWLDIPPDEFMRGAVHEILNQMTGIKALLDLMHTADSLAALEVENAISPVLDNLDMAEITEAARGSCSNVVTALNLVYGYAIAHSEAQATVSEATPPAPSAPVTSTEAKPII